MVMWRRTVQARRRIARIDRMRLTANQREFLKSTEQRVVWRDANQIGKSWGLAYDAIQFCRGKHPVQTHRPPVRVIVAGTSVEQMEPLMRTIWELLPRDEIDPNVDYVPGRGITGKPPRIEFVSGPGKGSLIKFVTYQQGAKRLAGATVHRGICDEPPPEEMIGELWPRLFRFGGSLRLGFTPTPDSPPLKYLYDLVSKGEVREINHGLTESACWPMGAPVPWKTQAQIDEYEAGLLEHEREMRMGRSWFATTRGAWLRSFSDACIKPFTWSDIPGEHVLLVGNDHGTAVGKQVAMLVAVSDPFSMTPKVWWIAETINEGFSTPEDDAQRIKAMLDSVDVRYEDVDHWVGDVPTGAKKYELRKSNSLLRHALGVVYRISRPRRIHEPVKYHSSLTDGCRTINAIFEHGNGFVHPRCEQFIMGCRTFDGHPAHPYKDPLDAGRYPVEHATRRRGHGTLVRFKR